MPSDLVYGIPPSDSQGQYKAEHDVLSVAKNCSLQVAESVDEHQDLFSTHIEEQERPDRITHVQELPVRKQRQERRPSPTIWRLALLVGDGMLLVALLLLIQALA